MKHENRSHLNPSMTYYTSVYWSMLALSFSSEFSTIALPLGLCENISKDHADRKCSYRVAAKVVNGVKG
jgi:hypothetical protein